MTSRVVKCGVELSKGLVSTVLDQGRFICSNCGTVVSDQLKTDNTHHTFYEFLGAFCPLDKMIHYRWVQSDWSVRENSFLRPKEHYEPIIIPKKSEVQAERYFIKSHFWQNDGNMCFEPGFTEVMWSDWEDSKLVLLRPMDTGYLKVNSNGMHTPFIGALIEWLLKRNEWTEIVTLAENSVISNREKKIIKKSVSQPTPSNIFKMLWTFKRYIPGWNSKRSLGKRSPSMLIVDEIRWTINRLNDLDDTGRDRLLRYGPEPQYWGIWPELWPEDVELGDTLADFGPEMKRIGINYDQTLSLITKPILKNQERSWMQIAEKMIQWPINVKKGGDIDTNLSQRSERGFVTTLRNNLHVAQEKEPVADSKWREYLITHLPLVWEKNGSALSFIGNSEYMTKTDLQETLKVFKPWIAKETKTEVVLTLHQVNEELGFHLKSMQKRLSDSTITIKIENG